MQSQTIYPRREDPIPCCFFFPTQHPQPFTAAHHNSTSPVGWYDYIITSLHYRSKTCSLCAYHVFFSVTLTGLFSHVVPRYLLVFFPWHPLVSFFYHQPLKHSCTRFASSWHLGKQIVFTHSLASLCLYHKQRDFIMALIIFVTRSDVILNHLFPRDYYSR